jgi:hypothetical protein
LNKNDNFSVFVFEAGVAGARPIRLVATSVVSTAEEVTSERDRVVGDCAVQSKNGEGLNVIASAKANQIR